MQPDTSITFVVLTYNHAGYVLEHLESIAHLVRRFDETEKHDLVVSDDASRDFTVAEVSLWLNENSKLFRNVTTYFRSENVGTCKSFLQATENIRTGYVKATGGDDLFSDEDIFSEVRRWSDADIIGSQPLVLIDGQLLRFHKFNLIYALANAVYSDRPFRDQLVGRGAIFTPGLIYSTALISDKRVRDFVSNYVLVEDLPSWVAISEYYPMVKYRLSEAHLVYYRRTPGSAYLIAGSRVFVDNLNCRQYLLDTENSTFNRLLLRNRVWLMTNCPPCLKNVCDFGKLVFAISLMANLPSAFNNFRLLFVDLGKHVRHYDRIKSDVVHLRSGGH
jgi:glycosyltransferase involved in cell wall biosynthesis